MIAIDCDPTQKLPSGTAFRCFQLRDGDLALAWLGNWSKWQDDDAGVGNGTVLDTDSFVSAEGTSSIGTAGETKFSAGKSAGLLGFHITLG
jgi:hypothetical protein